MQAGSKAFAEGMLVGIGSDVILPVASIPGKPLQVLPYVLECGWQRRNIVSPGLQELDTAARLTAEGDKRALGGEGSAVVVVQDEWPKQGNSDFMLVAPATHEYRAEMFHVVSFQGTKPPSRHCNGMAHLLCPYHPAGPGTRMLRVRDGAQVGWQRGVVWEPA
jgi:hypothetical protein